MDFYHNVTEFFEDIIDVSREFLRCYVSRVAIQSEAKDLYTLKGRVIWQRDLLNFADEYLSAEEITEYDKLQEELRNRLYVIKNKCAKSAENKVIIPFMYLINRLKCNEFETLVLFQLMAVEFDAELSKAYAVIMNEANVFTPSLEVCACMYTLDKTKQKEILAEEYIRLPLLEMFLEEDFTSKSIYTNATMPLHLSRRIIDFSINMNSENRYTGAELSMIWPWSGKDEVPYIFSDVAKRIIEYSATDKGRKIICLTGEEGAGKHFQLRQFSKLSRLNVVLVDVNTLYPDKNDLNEQLKRIAQECMIRNAVVAFENVDLEVKSEFVNNLGGVLERFFEFGNMVFLLMDRMPDTFHNSKLKEYFLTIDLGEITREERVLIWKHVLEGKEEFRNISPENMAVRFEFTPGKIISSVRTAKKAMVWENRQTIEDRDLSAACYKQVSHRLSDKAVKLNARYTWDDLIMAPEQIELLKAACNQVKFKHTVYDKWGFSAKNHYGQGVSMMFYGPPGTGKTMTAQVIANELNMEIYKVDLSTVMSKYIGETEKNLSVIFEEVKKSNSILFFDEADSLFGKRTETKDSNDKYANAETSYLLQKMEEYSGIVILATNYMQNFDEAYKRRIKFMIHFSFPGVEERTNLWKSCFAKDAPVENIDYEFLGEHFEMAGSHIKNVVVNAAFLAAAKGKPIGMEEIITALKHENEKYGKILTKEDVGEYYYLL